MNMVDASGLIAGLVGVLVAVSQSVPPKATPGCRTFSSYETRRVTTPVGQTATVVQRCEYNKSTNEFTCRGEHRTPAAAYNYEATFTFASIEDFLNDPVRIVLFGHPQRATTRHPGTGINLVSQATYQYDRSGRLTRLSVDTAGTRTDEIFTAWDSFGRPTAATVGPNAMTYSYDDTKRTATTTVKPAGTVVVKFFDVNGIEIGDEQRGPAGKVTNKWTIHSTATVCR